MLVVPDSLGDEVAVVAVVEKHPRRTVGELTIERRPCLVRLRLVPLLESKCAANLGVDGAVAEPAPVERGRAREQVDEVRRGRVVGPPVRAGEVERRSLLLERMEVLSFVS